MSSADRSVKRVVKIKVAWNRSDRQIVTDSAFAKVYAKGTPPVPPDTTTPAPTGPTVNLINTSIGGCLKAGAPITVTTAATCSQTDTTQAFVVPAANVALTAFDVDRTPAEDGARIVVNVANFSSAPQPVHLTITRGADALFDRSITVAASGTHRDVLAVPSAGDARFHAHVSAAGNALDVDDDAGAWLWTAQPLRVGVVGAASRAAALLAHDPTLRVTAIDPARYADANADVWVFDRWLPATAPAQPALVIDPPDSS